MSKSEQKRIGRARRHQRIRAKVSGTLEMPRLSVYKSNRYLHAQVIDDTKGVTLAAGSTSQLEGKGKRDAARELGEILAKQAAAKGITRVVFDRGGFRYAGRIAALAEAARAAGLLF